MPKNDEVIFDFIRCKMLQLREQVVWADKEVYADDYEYTSYYKVITCTESGIIRKYVKYLTTDAPDEWMLMNTM